MCNIIDIEYADILLNLNIFIYRQYFATIFIVLFMDFGAWSCNHSAEQQF